jgi:PKD repeat protein
VLTGVNAIPANGLQNGTAIAFSGQALKDPDGDSLTYAWEFGDGGTETSATPTHVYTTTGTFAPKLTVSDGKHTVTASTSVTIKSLTGTWTGQVPAGNPAFVTGTFILTQSGTSISGTYSDQFGPGTIASGTVRTTTPIVTMTINQQGFTPFVFTSTTLGSDVNTITGVLNQSGFNNAALTITRR